MKPKEDIELDLAKIERLGKIREEENIEFRLFLKQQDPDKIDRIVHRLNRIISEQIDCTTCRNCCKKLQPSIVEKDIERLSNRLHITTEQVIDQYTEIYDEELYFKNLPCVFLKDNKCTIYDDRPEDCRSYPHLHKDSFIFRLWDVIDNYSICPIVFNVFERLKTELNFNKYGGKNYPDLFNMF